MTDFSLYDPDENPEPPPKTDTESRLGMFTRSIATRDRYATVENVCRYHGFAALEPNTVLLPWSAHRHDPERFAQLVDAAAEMDLNLLLFAEETVEKHKEPRIDVWWRPDAGNLSLSLALLRFISRVDEWERASVRFILLSTDSSMNDHLRTITRRMLVDARFDASIRIINDALEDRDLEQRIVDESLDAALVILGLPNEAGQVDPKFQERADKLEQTLNHVLFIRASSVFRETLTVSREAAVSFLPPTDAEGGVSLPELTLPETPDLAREVTAFAADHQRWVTRFHEDCIKRVHARHVELVRGVIASAERYYDELAKAAQSANPRRMKNAQNRAQSSFLLECTQALEEFEQTHLPEQQGILAERIDAFLEHGRSDERAKDRDLVIHRSRKDFAAAEGDSEYLQSFKRWRRFGAWIRRTDEVRYRVPVGRLRDHYFYAAVREVLKGAVRQLETDTHQLAIHLGKILNSSKVDHESETVGAAVEEQKEKLLARLEDLVQHSKQRVGRQQWSMLVTSLELAESYARDIERLDVRPFVKSVRSVPKHAQVLQSELREIPERWLQNQRQLLSLATLALRLSSFQHRLAALTSRERDAITLDVKSGVLSQIHELEGALGKLSQDVALSGQQKVALRVHVDFRKRFDPKPFIDGLIRETGEIIGSIPESVQTLTEDSVQALEEGKSDAVELTELPVRRLVQFLVEAELIGRVQEELERVPKAEQRAAGVAQDVLRLVSFQIGELEAGEGDEKKQAREQLCQVVDNGLERIQAEAAELEAIVPALGEHIDERLGAVLDGTNAYDLGSTAANLEQHIRLHQGRIAVSGARGLLRRGLVLGRRVLVDLIYRRSAGQLLARQLEREAGASTELGDRVVSLVSENTPRPEVLSELPFYYRQLFFGQSALGESFWVGRKAELAKAKRAIGSFERGADGAIFVTGERGSGKTALSQRIVSELCDKRRIVRVHPRPGGCADPFAFQEALERATESSGSPSAVVDRLPDGSVIVVDDLELWWERSIEGFGVIDLLIDLIERHGRRCLFLIVASRQSFQLMNRFRPLADHALCMLECRPMSAEALKAIVTLRHGSTGVKYTLGARSEGELGDVRLARLFSSYFDYSGGQIGAALRAWITHVDRVSGDTLTMRAPHQERWHVLDDMKPEWVALLLQILLHKQVSLSRLAHVSPSDEGALRRDLDTLSRLGLVVESRQRVLELNPFVQHILLDRFAKRGLIA